MRDAKDETGRHQKYFFFTLKSDVELVWSFLQPSSTQVSLNLVLFLMSLTYSVCLDWYLAKRSRERTVLGWRNMRIQGSS